MLTQAQARTSYPPHADAFDDPGGDIHMAAGVPGWAALHGTGACASASGTSPGQKELAGQVYAAIAVESQ